MRCALCKKEVYLSYRCSYCDQYFCDDHRLPEQHMCPGLQKRDWESRRKIQIRQSVRTHARKIDSVKPQKVSSPKTRSIKGKIILLLIIIGISSLLYIQYNPSIGDTQKYIEDVDEEIEKGYQELKEVPEDQPAPLNPFLSVDELIRFLDNDNVSDVVYASDFTCGDFAEALVNRAHDAEYDLKVYSIFDSELDDFKQYVESLSYVKEDDSVRIITSFRYGLGAGHAICNTEIGSVVYVIEPQNDMVFEVIEDGYDIVYFGEVTK